MVDVYDANRFEQVAITLFYGWGYNFYKAENQLRADDQRIRTEIALLLGQVHKTVQTASGRYRDAYLPPPSRDHPLPDPTAVANARRLTALVNAVSGLAALIRTLPAPENDRMTQRYRKERETLVRLGEMDTRLVAQVEYLRQMVTGQNAQWLLDNMDMIEAAMGSIETVLRDRAQMLV